jgi:hypothetical protein
MIAPAKFVRRADLTHRVEFRPAWDKRHADPKRNYGIHGVELRFLVQGPLGATQFVMYSGWNLKHVREERRDDRTASYFPMAADLGYHSPRPMYEGQEPMQHCDLLPAGTCYYDGSGLNAEPVMESLIEEGDDAVWRKLEDEYRYRFETTDEGESQEAATAAPAPIAEVIAQ